MGSLPVTRPSRYPKPQAQDCALIPPACPPSGILRAQMEPDEQSMPMTDFARRERWQWWLLLLLVGLFALGIRYYYVTHAQVFQPVNQPNVRGDAVEYYRYAFNLSAHGVFSKAPAGTTPLVGDSFRDPGYPLFLAGWMKVFGQWDSWYAAVLLSQALLGALTVMLMLALARRWMPPGWLAAAGVLMAVWPHSVAMSSYLLSETLFGFLAALGLLLLRVGLDRHRAGWAAASGIGFSLAALTNAVLIPFAPLLAVYLFVRKKASGVFCASLAIAALAVVTPWMVRNSLIHATAKDSSSSGLALIAHRMASRPGHYLWWYLSKPALLWDWDIRIGQGDVYVYPTRNSPFKSNVAFRAVGALCHSLNPWFFALAIVGALLALLPRQAPQPDQAAAALMFVFVPLVSSVLQAEPRYSVPFRGLEIVLSAFAAHRLRRYIGQKRTLAKIRATTTQQLPTLDDPIVESAPNPAPEPANDAAGILPPSTPSH